MSDGHPKAEERRNQTEDVKYVSVHLWGQESGRERIYRSLSAPVEGSGCCLREGVGVLVDDHQIFSSALLVWWSYGGLAEGLAI